MASEPPTTATLFNLTLSELRLFLTLSLLDPALCQSHPFLSTQSPTCEQRKKRAKEKLEETEYEEETACWPKRHDTRQAVHSLDE
jgi:hypothetical protein